MQEDTDKKEGMMFTSTKMRQLLQSIKAASQQVFEYISDAALKIFSPTQDDYPATGVQPFKGDPADEK
ncbi:MAG TPA: hypothetical protein V6C57_04265 [Coleofasciculaceae cyanobacterium]